MEGLRQRRKGDDDYELSPSKSKSPKITLESFDLYQKTESSDHVQTSSGATLSIASIIVIVILVINAFHGYIFPTRNEHIMVDPVVGGRLQINFDVTFPALSCDKTNLDAMDLAGEQQNGIDHNMLKQRLDGITGKPIGNSYIEHEGEERRPSPTPMPADYCGSCFGASESPEDCCNTCESLRAAYIQRNWDVDAVQMSAEQCATERRHMMKKEKPLKGEGCRVKGSLTVNKVSGNFHMAMGEAHSTSSGHVHQFNMETTNSFNVTHRINSLSFGTPFPGRRDPLDGVLQVPEGGTGVYMYYIKVIPTEYVNGRNVISTNQYSISTQYRPAFINGVRQYILPGLFFVYEISPFMVRVTETYAPLSDVFTSLLAILGGVLSAAAFIDTILFKFGKSIFAKFFASSDDVLLGKGPSGSSNLFSVFNPPPSTPQPRQSSHSHMSNF